MKNIILKLSMAFFFTLVLTQLFAQQGVVSSGVNASGSGGSVSYSVGQVVYTTNTGTNGSVAQGLQQPFEISVIIGLEDTEGISLACMAYPNPTSDFLILKVVDYDMENLIYQLLDMNGKLMECKKAENNETRISMEYLPSAIYFLKVIKENKDIKTFKIIKN